MTTRFRAILWLLAGLSCVIAPVAKTAPTNSAWFARGWQLDDGLPNNNVNALAQTDDGYLWVATAMGVARFDGLRFEEISSTNFIPPPNRGVMALLCGRSGNLWLAMDRGAIVNVSPQKIQVVTPSNGLPDLIAETMTETPDGTLWISYLGGAIGRLKDGRFTNVEVQQLPWGPVSSVAQDIHHHIWLARAGQVGIFENGRFQSLYRLDYNFIRIAPARNGGVWICSGPELFFADLDAPPKYLGTVQTSHPDAGPGIVFEDHNGAVWVGMAFAGLHRFAGERFEKIDSAHPEISNLLEDREGNIWVGTRGAGLCRLRPRAVRLDDTETGLAFPVQSACEDVDGTLWVTTENGLLERQSTNGWITVSTNPDWPGGIASCVASDPNGSIWIGTRNHRLIRRHDGHYDSWGKSKGLSASPILTLLVATNGDLWIGGQNHIVQRFSNEQFYDFNLPDNAGVVRAATQDAAGNVWFGTSRGLLLRASNQGLIDETRLTGTVFQSIRGLYAAADGTVWIGAAGNGLGRLKDGKLAVIGPPRGMADGYISQIIDDGHGWMWFGSDHGIFKVRLDELNAAADGLRKEVHSVRYGRGEGLQNLQANFGYEPAGFRRRDGHILIPTRTALAIVNPAVSGESADIPSVLLKRVAVDEKTIAVHAGVLNAANKVTLDRLPASLRLEPGHRKLEFEFTAFNFAAPENLRLQYRMEGFDNLWIDAPPQRSVSYPQLPAGNYRFQVRACNSSGVWNESSAIFAFIVAPFFWQTWWFESAAVLLFAAVVFVIVRYVAFRRLRLRLQVLEQETALHKERSRIARDLHDDLGSRLTKIVLLSDLLHDGANAKSNAQQISTNARQVIKALDETVWAINPRHDILPDLIDYIGQSAVDFLRAANIRCRLDLPVHPPDRAISVEVRHNLFLAVKESLNNIVRHSDATEVTLRMNVSGRTLALVIEDNGRGFAGLPDDAGADGLRNMRQRMEEIGGRFQMQSAPGNGTKIFFDIPLKR